MKLRENSNTDNSMRIYQNRYEKVPKNYEFEESSYLFARALDEKRPNPKSTFSYFSFDVTVQCEHEGKGLVQSAK